MLRFVLLSCLGLFLATDASKQQALEPLTKFRMLLNAEGQCRRLDLAIVLQVRLIEKQPKGSYVVGHTCMIRRPSRCVLCKPNVFFHVREIILFACLCVLRDARIAQRQAIPKAFPVANGVTLRFAHDFCFWFRLLNFTRGVPCRNKWPLEVHRNGPVLHLPRVCHISS